MAADPANPAPQGETFEFVESGGLMVPDDYLVDDQELGQDERNELIKIHNEAEQNVEYFLRHRKKLFSRHRGKWALIHLGDDGKSHMKISEELPPLLNHERNGPSSLIEWLDVEISA